MPRKRVKAAMVTLRSCDCWTFRVRQHVASVSETIKNIVEVGFTSVPIVIPTVTADILDKVLEYCEVHASPRGGRGKTPETLNRWDSRFIQLHDQDTLHGLLLAANYLSIQGLVDLAIDRLVKMLRGKNPEQIRQMLNIQNDFSSGEREVRRIRPSVLEGRPRNNDHEASGSGSHPPL